MGDKRDLIVVPGLPIARVSEWVAQCWKQPLEESHHRRKYHRGIGYSFRERIRKHERLKEDGQHGAFKQGLVLRKALPVEGNLPDRFQGCCRMSAVLNLSTLLLNQLADTQICNPFVPLSWVLPVNGTIIASTNQG